MGMSKAQASKIFSQHGRVLPKTIHAKWIWDARDPWLDAEEDMRTLADRDETVFVGEYKLVKIHKVELKLTTGK
jgi:hypothetical protein